MIVKLYYLVTGIGLWLLSLPLAYWLALRTPSRLPIASEIVGNKAIVLPWSFRLHWARQKSASLLLRHVTPPPSVEEVARATLTHLEQIQALTGKPAPSGMHSFAMGDQDVAVGVRKADPPSPTDAAP